MKYVTLCSQVFIVFCCYEKCSVQGREDERTNAVFCFQTVVLKTKNKLFRQNLYLLPSPILDSIYCAIANMQQIFCATLLNSDLNMTGAAQTDHDRPR